MSDPTGTTDLAKRSFAAGRRRDIAALLPVAGIAVFATPFLRIFTRDTTFFGVPLIFGFLYAAWLGLILAGWWLARRLSSDTDR